MDPLILIRQSVLGYRCKSNMPFHSWKVIFIFLLLLHFQLYTTTSMEKHIAPTRNQRREPPGDDIEEMIELDKKVSESHIRIEVIKYVL